MSINGVIISRSFYYDDASAIVGVVEIWIIPAVPHKVAVPGEIGVAESNSHTIIRSVHGITISEAHGIIGAHRGGSIVRIVSIVIVEIGPAGFVLGFHPDIIIAGGCAVIFPVGAGARFAGGGISGLIACCGSNSLGSGRIIDVVGSLCRLSRGRATAHQDKTSGQEG
jgi:hypothetical protein